jgi:hypothetical protein
VGLVRFRTDSDLECLVANVHEFSKKIQSSVLYGNPSRSSNANHSIKVTETWEEHTEERMGVRSFGSLVRMVGISLSVLVFVTLGTFRSEYVVLNVDERLTDVLQRQSLSETWSNVDKEAEGNLTVGAALLPSTENVAKKAARLNKSIQASASSLPDHAFPSTVPGSINNDASVQKRKKGMYSNARTDRSGAVIQDMLAAHSYAFHHSMTYLGACWTDPKAPNQARIKTNKQLFAAVGLEDELTYACPTNMSDIVRPGLYLHSDRRWSPEWRAFIQTRVKYPKRNVSAGHQTAVHIRRGDAIPCPKDGSLNRYRYLPNSYYQAMIDMYVPPNSTVTIYSEEDSYEPWDDFKQYNLRLSTSLTDTWRDMMMADTLILSRSAFSLIPALLNRHGTIWYIPFWWPKVDGWETVPENITAMADLESAKIRNEDGCVTK